MTKKIDFKEELKPLYKASAMEPAEVQVPPINYLMVDGEGDPNHSPAFEAAIEALYSLSYTIKFALKKGASAIDYGVMPLEGLWWADDMASFSIDDKSSWKWTLMIMQPPFVTPAVVDQAITDVKRKKNPKALGLVHFAALAEGRCAQILHVGPFSAEGPTVARLHRFIAERGCRLVGKHHEIYLSDPRRTDPAKLKTLLRQPML